MTRAQARWLAKLQTLVAPVLCGMATLVVLVSTYLIFDKLIDAAPGGQVPREIAVTLRPGESIDIGRRHLLQPAGPAAAVDRHIRIARTDSGWMLSSPTGLRRALMQFQDGSTTFVHRWPLANGDEVRLPNGVLRFDTIDHVRRRITLDVRTAAGTRRHELDLSFRNRGVLTPASTIGEPGWVGTCNERALPLRVLLGLRHLATGTVEGWRWAERLLRRFQDQPRLLIGGVLSCSGGFDVPRLALPGLEARELILVERGGRFLLAPGPTQPALLIRRGTCRYQGFQDIAWRIDGVPMRPQDCAVEPSLASVPSGPLSSVVLGRTRYDVAISGDRLTMKPVLNVPLLTDTELQTLAEERQSAGILTPMPALTAMPDRTRWISLGQALRHVGSFGLGAILVLLLPFATIGGLFALRLLPAWRIARSADPGGGRTRRLVAMGLLGLSLLLTALSTVLLSGVLPPEAGEVAPKALFALVLFNYAVASLAVAMEARSAASLAILWIAVLVLMGSGLLNMAQLGFGADSSRFIELYTGQLRVFGLLPPAVIAAAFVRIGLVRQATAPLFSSERPVRSFGLYRQLFPRRPSGSFAVWDIARQVVRTVLSILWFLVLGLLVLLFVALLVTAALESIGIDFMLLDRETSAVQHIGYAVVTALVIFLVYRLPLIAFSLKAAPLLALTAMFLAWLALGGETGLGPFQPVELGKFAAVGFLSLFLIALDRRQASREPVVPASLFFIYGAAVVFFILLFAVVPALKSDFSPVLIVTLTSIALVAIAGARQASRLLLGDLAAARLQRWRDRRWMAAPTHLRQFRGRLIDVPAVGRRIPLAWLATAFRFVAALVIVGGGLLLVREVIAPFFWDEYARARERLEALLAVDDVGKLAQRALSYRDLDLDRPATADEAGNQRRIVDYRDLGLQVILSRRAIASAPCHSLADLTGDPRHFVILRMLFGRADPPPRPTTVRPVSARPATTAAPVTAPAGPVRHILGVTCTDTAGRPFGRNPELVQRIPAVKDDFSAAFFVNRFGLGAGFLLGLAQIVLLAVLVSGAFRVRRAPLGDHRETALRFALFGMMLGGAILFALHWGISWSNQVGLLPVMGQPMTFLSLGGSHLTLMAFPLVLVAIIGLRFVSEGEARRPHFVPLDPPPPRFGGV